MTFKKRLKNLGFNYWMMFLSGITVQLVVVLLVGNLFLRDFKTFWKMMIGEKAYFDLDF